MHKVASIVGLCLFVAAAAAVEPPKIGDFELRDFRGKVHRLGDLTGKKAVVVAFLGVECPLAKSYVPRLNDLSKEFAPKGVAFLAIDSNLQDSLTDMGNFARASELAIPFLKDPDAKIADVFGAERTPEVFLLDEERVVRYRGRIDDQYGFGLTAGYAKTGVQERYLASAIDAVLSGRPVAKAKIDAEGCLIGRPPKAQTSGTVTFTKDVAKILNQRCVECHRSGEVAPFPLTSYEETLGWAAMILEVVDSRRMPPWFADPAYGHFRNDMRLSETEIATLKQWVAGGCPEGDPKDLPPAPEFVAGWRIGEPDAVVHIDDEPFQVPAEGVVPYQYFSVDPGFTEDKWIAASEARPGNREVVHHIIVFAVPPGGGGRGGFGGGRLGVAGYAPGEQPRVYPEGVALKIPKGYHIAFQMHYTPNGRPQKDRSSVGFRFIDPKLVKKPARGGAAINAGFVIPAGASNHEVTSRYTFRRDALLTMLFPHMHLRGKAFRFEAVYPDGKREILLDVPRYDFNWQLRYDLAEPKRIPKGTELLCTAHFDNSEDNPANPDPKKPVRWGPQTWDEMMIGFFETVPIKEGLDAEPLPGGRFGRGRNLRDR